MGLLSLDGHKEEWEKNMLPTTASKGWKDSLDIKSLPPHSVKLCGAGSVTEEGELQSPAQLSLPEVTAHGQGSLGGFPGAQLRAVVWKSSDVLLLNRPSSIMGIDFSFLESAAHAETC